jgi:hypothetical protein
MFQFVEKTFELISAARAAKTTPAVPSIYLKRVAEAYVNRLLASAYRWAA